MLATGEGRMQPRVRSRVSAGWQVIVGDVSGSELPSQCRREVAAAIGVDEADLELSMGMSGDFEVRCAVA